MSNDVLRYKVSDQRDEWSGTIDEWGEVYVLLRVLSDGMIYHADSHGNPIHTECFAVDFVQRTETNGCVLTLTIVGDEVVVSSFDGTVRHVDRKEFERNARSLFRHMTSQKGTTARHPEQAFLKSLGIESLKAGPKCEGDLIVHVQNATAWGETLSYDIKTILGGRPALSKASDASLIDYELVGFDEDMEREVMSITSPHKVAGRIKRILELLDEPPVVNVRSKVFEKNLVKCFYCAPDAIGYALLYGQTTRGEAMVDSIALLCENNPCGFDDEDICDYEVAIGEYLMAAATGMTAEAAWPRDTGVDGHLIVTRDGDVVSFHTAKSRFFADYLILHSCWDTPSTQRHKDVGEVWRDYDGKWYFTLNCAARCVADEYSGANLRYLRHQG